MATRRLNDRDTFAGDVIAEERGGSNAIFQVVLVQRFLETNGDRIEVASGEAAVGRKAFGQDEEIFLLLGEDVVVGAEKAAYIDEAILFGGHGAAVGEGKH